MGTTTLAPVVAIKNIVVMTDLSPASDHALRYAAGWAKRLGAVVHVAHFIRPMTYAMAGDAYGLLMERLWQEGREGLAAIEASDVLRGIPHTTNLDPGEILDGLSVMVQARQADLIVLASAGRRGLEKLLLGSTAEAIFRSVACPTFILGPACGSYQLTRPPKNILVALDFGAAAERTLAHALSLSRQASAVVYIMHVLPPPTGECASCLSEAELAEARMRAMFVATREGAAEPEYAVKFGHPAEEIVKAAWGYGADVIVLGARRPPKMALYTGWATAYQVLSEAPCPVFTVRE